MSTILLLALSTLVSEDLTCIAAGVLISQHQLSVAQGLLGCTLGIFFGDLLLVLAGRYATLLRIQTPPLLAALEHRATSALLWTRFTPGLRLPTYLSAGLLRLPMRAVIPPLAAGSALWTPLLVGLAAIFGATFVKSLLEALQLLVAATVLWLVLRDWDRRRRIAAFFCRLARWEFWPSWAAYLPLIPYLLWLGLKHRSLTIFTAANPGIPTGGLLGESKSAILRRLTAFSPPFELVATIEDALRFADRHGLPMVLKPDVGERGTGVAIIRSIDEIRRYFNRAGAPVIAQQYVPGEEFGVFYTNGRITSITHKRLPFVTGDGRRTLRELVLADRRAFILHAAYLQGLDGSRIAEAGERVQLVEIGSHCRGAIFHDATHLVTPELERAIRAASQAHPGFHLGRYDLRATSIDALQQGQFLILELNGVGAEATHIYDPAVSLWDAYRAMFRQWRTAFEIGAANRERGAAPTSVWNLLRTWRAL